jgi:hypothetical protein
MVFDPIHGCVRGEESIGPSQTMIDIIIENEKDLWRSAVETPIHASLQSNLDKIYEDKLKGEKISELLKKEHPVFPGLTTYGLSDSNLLAYRCGFEKIIIAGSPEIQESPDVPGHVNYNCVCCKLTLYSEDAIPNKRN